MPTKKLNPHEDSLDFINSIEATCANLRCQIGKTFGPQYSLYVLSFAETLKTMGCNSLIMFYDGAPMALPASLSQRKRYLRSSNTTTNF